MRTILRTRAQNDERAKVVAVFRLIGNTFELNGCQPYSETPHSLFYRRGKTTFTFDMRAPGAYNVIVNGQKRKGWFRSQPTRDVYALYTTPYPDTNQEIAAAVLHGANQIQDILKRHR